MPFVNRHTSGSSHRRTTAWLAVMVATLALQTGCGARDPILPPFTLEHTYSPRDPEFRRVMDQVCGHPAVDGNSVRTYQDLGEIVPAMVAAIQSAKHTITCETFILSSDSVGRTIMDALKDQARTGVQVHLIVDDVGSVDIDANDVQSMKDAGIHFVRFNAIHKLLFFFTAGDVNHRSHRKLLVIDGRVGFTGGIGFSDLWLGKENGGNPWRENGYRIEGPVVGQMQGAFLMMWLKLVGQMLEGESYLPALSTTGEMDCQIIVCSPQSGLARIELTYLLAINAADQSVDIATAYFVPDDPLVNALSAAAGRGVRVRIIMPGKHTDSNISRDASKARWAELLDAGVQLYEYQPGMYHCKVMIVDQYWSAVGSANLDPRSLRLNEEANLIVLDDRFANEQTAIIERDLNQATHITEWEHEKRSVFEHITQFFASLFSPQL